MSDETSMSVANASKHARKNPNDATEAIQTLFDYVEDGGDDASSAAASLALVAGRAPAAFDGQTDRFERALETADGVHTRRDVAEAVNELLEQHAIPPGDAGPALSEAARIRDHEYWRTRPKDGLLIVQEGLEGWTDLAAMGETVPEAVVERAVGLINNADLTTLLRIIDVSQAAVESESKGTEIAFESLVELARVDDSTVTSEATIAIAELILSGDIPDENAARDVITSNADTAQRDSHIVEQALAEISS